MEQEAVHPVGCEPPALGSGPVILSELVLQSPPPPHAKVLAPHAAVAGEIAEVVETQVTGPAGGLQPSAAEPLLSLG